jgi:hypothetical protein
MDKIKMFFANIIDMIKGMLKKDKPVDVTYTPPFPSQTTPVTIQARIRNNGTNVLNTVQRLLKCLMVI